MQWIHQVLGLLGLIPFIGLAILNILNWFSAPFLLVSYAALIISFLAGVVWMQAMQAQKSYWLAIGSNLFMLASWGLLLLAAYGVQQGIFYALACLLLLVYLLEYFTLKTHYPNDFFSLRTWLTLIASISLIITDFLN